MWQILVALGIMYGQLLKTLLYVYHMAYILVILAVVMVKICTLIGTNFGVCNFSVALIHHLSIVDRRKKAIDKLIRVNKPSG